jgi:hypothetical protein
MVIRHVMLFGVWRPLDHMSYQWMRYCCEGCLYVLYVAGVSSKAWAKLLIVFGSSTARDHHVPTKMLYLCLHCRCVLQSVGQAAGCVWRLEVGSGQALLVFTTHAVLSAVCCAVCIAGVSSKAWAKLLDVFEVCLAGQRTAAAVPQPAHQVSCPLTFGFC